MNFFISNVVSFFVGIGSSYGVWFYIQRFLIPKIVFAEHLNKYEIPDGRYIWRTKILNSGKRDIIDLEIMVRIGIKEFKGANGWAYHSIKANTSRAPILKKMVSYCCEHSIHGNLFNL